MEQKARDEFDASVKERLGDAFNWEDLKMEDPDVSEAQVLPNYDDEVDGTIPPVPDIDVSDPDTYDQYVGAEVLLPKDDQVQTAKVIGRKRESDGTFKGKANHNPILDTRTYEVEFPDGKQAEFSANVIAENMYAQCDTEGNQHLLLDEIVDHKKSEHAVEKADMYIQAGSNRQMRKTTKGWFLEVRWKDGTTSWQRLADLKESYPVQVAEYATLKGISDEPAFAWWVPYVLRKRNRILAAVKGRVIKKTHKFGIEIPTTVEQALEIDKKNGNTLWQDAINKEMKNVRVAFKVLDDDEKISNTYQYISCHMIFDVKMEDFRRKARLVAGGHVTSAPASITYATVVSRESVRIALTLAALNDLEVKSSDIENAYLTAPSIERLWTTCGPEFGSDAGKRALIVRALYGTKSAGHCYSHHMKDCMRTLGWTSCLADQDVWMKAETKPDGTEYYAYMLLFVDDCLCIHHDAVSVLQKLDHFFKMKPGSIGDPNYYLGAKLRKMTMPNGVHCWSFSSSKYIQAAVENVKDYLKSNNLPPLAKTAPTPFKSGYEPELDTTPELDYDRANYYQSQIGMLRWMVEIGRVDLITEVSLLSSHLALPREGHLEAIFHIYAYLSKKHNARMAFDPSYPEIDLNDFKTDENWKAIYGDVQEPIPPNAPAPRGKPVDLRLYVDSDHAGDKIIRRSRTGFLHLS